MGVTGCNYGAHSFKFSENLARTTHHIHTCTECDATYVRPGTDGCAQCKPAEREMTTEEFGTVVIGIALQQAKAQAWDEGYAAGQLGGRENPYR